MIKPKFEDFDYGEGRKDLSWCQYANALEEYVTFLEAQDPAFRQSLVVGRSELLTAFSKDLNRERGLFIPQSWIEEYIESR